MIVMAYETEPLSYEAMPSYYFIFSFDFKSLSFHISCQAVLWEDDGRLHLGYIMRLVKIR